MLPGRGPRRGDYETFKAGSERAVERWFAGEKLILAPGVILGPYENVGRLPSWLNRVRRGGRFLAPGDPGRPLQFIDVRDVAAFLLDRAERGAGDRFLVSPAARRHHLRRAARRVRRGSPGPTPSRSG